MRENFQVFKQTLSKNIYPKQNNNEFPKVFSRREAIEQRKCLPCKHRRAIENKNLKLLLQKIIKISLQMKRNNTANAFKLKIFKKKHEK